MREDCWKSDISAIALEIREGNLSPECLTRHMIQRICSIDPKVKSYVTLTGETALDEARRAEKEIHAGHYRGPLHGVPIAIKDIFDTAGVATTSCSKVREGYIPQNDCTIVRRFREAGAIILGKLTTHEFAFGFDSMPTRNPWNLDHIPSGSSGGSGAAVAAGLCFAATGSDTGGSIRAPAAANGVAGIKPTYGRCSKAGVTVLSWSLDHTGPIARSARDLAILLQIMAGQDTLDPHSKAVPVPDYAAALNGEVAGLRLGIPTNYFFEDVQPCVADAVENAIRKLEALGAKIVNISIPHLNGALDFMLAIALAEAAAYHKDALRKKADCFTTETRVLLEAGSLMFAGTYIDAQRGRSLVKAGFEEAFRGIDALLTPTQPTTALRAGQTVSRIGDKEESVFAVSARLCAPFNLSGLPAASIPCGYSAEGMPIGLQIVGKPFDEATVLRIADAYERHTRWHESYPAIAL